MSNTFQWKKLARKQEEVAHKTCPLMFYQREESCPDCIGEALPTPPIIQASAAAAKSLQSCPTLCDTIDGSPPGCPIPDSPGKSTGVGCHCLLQSRALRVFKQVCWTLDRLSHFFLITLLQNKGYNFLYFTYKHLLFAWHLKPQTKMIQTDTVVTFLESTLSWRE